MDDDDGDLYLGLGDDDPKGSQPFNETELWTFPSSGDTTAGNTEARFSQTPVPEHPSNPATSSTPGATAAEVSQPAVVYPSPNFNQQ